MKLKRKNQWSAWWFLGPALLGVALFSIFPIIRAFVMSFQSGSLISMHWTGLSNYKYVIADPYFGKALQNTVLYAFTVVPIGLVISILIAWNLFNRIKHSKFFETLFFMPYVTSTIAIGIVFRYIFNGQYGILNYILKFFHLGTPDWLDNPSMNMITVIIFGVWLGLAFNIVILMSALRGIDPQHYTIAKMYGANNREMFFRITLPQLIPTLAFLLTVNLINAFKVYTQIYALFNGQPGIAGSAMTAVYYIFDKFQIDGTPGIAMAATVLLFMIILVISFLQNKLLEKVGRR
ncbi:carbohydrate ABC transporter permease [Ligilactobacillus sp. LYQ135]